MQYLFMESASCIGCRTSFQDTESLELQSLTIQFKNYQIPFRDDTAKWNILKAIISFLNTKGGTIYIGVEDQKGIVQGLFLQRKQRDNFKLSMKQLIQKIYPKVDLNNKQEVKIQYVPIFKINSFQGKFVVKIIVQQGDPSQVYCMSERIKLEGGQNNKIDQFQVYYAYERHNMGGTQQIKGVKLMNYIREKAKNPNKVISSFHESCNPQPPYLQLQIRTILLSNISAQQNQYLQSVFDSQFQKIDIDYQTKYLKQKSSSQLYIEDEKDFNMVKEYILTNIDYLNSIFQETEFPTNFEVKGEVQHYFQVMNKQKEKAERSKKEKNPDKYKKKEQNKKENKFPYKEKIFSEIRHQNLNFKTPQSPKKKQQTKQKQEQEVSKEKLTKGSIEQQVKNNNNSKFIITFTHIEPKSILGLEKFLNRDVIRAYDKKFYHYINSLEVQFTNQKQRQNYLAQLLKKEEQLSSFGFKRQIRFGINTNEIIICNMDWRRIQQAKKQLQSLINQHLISFRSQPNALICLMNDHTSTCQCLDQLLNNRQFKRSFQRRGNRQQNIPKLKFYINVGSLVKK